VLEGKYWKRRLESVTAEYKKWRRFYMERALHALTNEDKLCMEEVTLETHCICSLLHLLLCHSFTNCWSSLSLSVCEYVNAVCTSDVRKLHT